MTKQNQEFLELAGVPVIVHPPANPSLPAPLIVLWHGFGIPNSEELLAEVLPLEEVQAWKAYLGLPSFGKRLPAGGIDEIERRYMEDFLLKLLLPTSEQAMQELPNVIEALLAKFPIDHKEEIGLFGFSAGGLAVLLTLLESSVAIKTIVLAGVTKDLVSIVDGNERAKKQLHPELNEEQIKYRWSEASELAKKRLDFIARASEIVKRQPIPAILFVHGSQDEVFAVNQIEELYAAIAPYYSQTNQSERLCLQTFEHLGHDINLEAAKNSPELQQDIAELQQVVTAWFVKHLSSKT
ncbi:prolyl oligopeptidase family serine peptidase [Plectonema cf. radiosum LEGE 06105]|uniref:Prolyl oligopeptidase family serine peptidase n=1 Tax=Plectonema cf. radiosum LEGE 06105 TaxID=945769 RepID=A0A8J7K0C0_9CYAN|nr:prolyl oligopeptidase family serine peptidase [Plectonema radiosum]MBE9213541.1 prolyl oligopeptidase family serine peptidase [Plectonema cf. radiosum LEGE 06105]